MKRILLIAFLLFPLANAYINTESITIHYVAEGNITIVHKSPSAQLINLTQDVYLYMQGKDYLATSLNDFSIIEKDGLKLFRLVQAGDASLIEWYLNARLLSKREIHNLSSIPAFPYDKDLLPSSVRKYLDYSELIDSNQVIVNKANELVAGASNYLEAAGRLAEWVSSVINYDTSGDLLTETKKASWVFNYRRGVCDEFSVLFMSLAKAVGIPVKYSYGYAFDNSEDVMEFGPHAWVEVYVPGYGWLPFDLTYKEYGWIDSTHLKTFSSYNVTRNLISTAASAYDFSNLKITNNVPSYLLASLNTGAVGFIEVESSVNETILFNASLTASKTILGGNDYALLTLTINNPEPYYMPLSFTFLTTNYIELVNSLRYNFVMLKPLSNTTKYFIIKTKNTGQAGIHPISIKLPGAKEVNENLTVYPTRPASTKLEELLMLIETDENPTTNIELKSLTVNPQISYGEQPFINISLRNNGTVQLSNVTIEVISSLVKTVNTTINSLGINEEVNKLIALELTNNTGEGNISIFIRSDAGLISSSADFIRTLKPELMINFSGETDYEKAGDTNFSVSINNNNLMNISFMNVSLKTNKAVVSDVYYPGVINLTLNYKLPVEILDYGNNTARLLIQYKDDYGSIFNEISYFNLYKKGDWYDLLIEWFKSIINAILSLFGL